MCVSKSVVFVAFLLLPFFSLRPFSLFLKSVACVNVVRLGVLVCRGIQIGLLVCAFAGVRVCGFVGGGFVSVLFVGGLFVFLCSSVVCVENFYCRRVS